LFKLTPKEKRLVFLLGALLALGLVLRLVLPENETFVAQGTGMLQGAGQKGMFIKNEHGAEEESGDVFSPEEEKLIIVHITGAVTNPGVYTLEEGSRVFHVVEKAGGHLEDADLERINLAQPLYDGQPVFIPRKSDRDNSSSTGGPSPAGDPSVAKVNINTASKAQLETLPGIGSVKAQNIISYREKNGPFQRIEDLVNVNGIGEKTLEGMKDFITIY
jgi:competence protein ComEA